jgi:sortase A
MRVIVHKTSMRLLLLWAQRLLFATAIATLGYCAYVWADRWYFDKQESRQLDLLIDDQTSVAATHLARTPQPALPDSRGLIGRMGIPRLGVSALLTEGTTNKILRRAVGHIAGTSLPGQGGNVGIAGHRDGFFRPLRNIQTGDTITITTPGTRYVYRVVSIRIVKPDDVAVLASDSTETLTLVTCYPFYFVGPAPDRFIVKAQRVQG